MNLKKAIRKTHWVPSIKLVVPDSVGHKVSVLYYRDFDIAKLIKDKVWSELYEE
ncbi:MAG: hypothetical protein ACR2PH_04370 [Desulfobulbia bacterium]